MNMRERPGRISSAYPNIYPPCEETSDAGDYRVERRFQRRVPRWLSSYGAAVSRTPPPLSGLKRNTNRYCVGLLGFLLVLASPTGQLTASTQKLDKQSTQTPGFYDPLPQDTGEAGLKLQLRKLQTTGRLMMVVAHPDDEDGGLLTREARGKGIQTLLMTLTRGEGGQNETGDTFSDELGILRTLELLAADRYYGVEQRFSRVADFGYSKTADETFQKWGGHDVPLADIVRVIREFRPDVLIARFSGTERDGHGHHQASSILTQEAFRAAADPKRFPDQIKEGLQPWQPKKLYVGNVCGFGATTCADENYMVQLTTSEEDPVLGVSYVQFAVEGLKHQQSQGLGDIRIPSGPRYAFYKLVDSVVPNTKDSKGHEKDLFDGIDTSLPGLTRPIADELNEFPWLLPALKKIGGSDLSDVNALSDNAVELRGLVDKLNESELDPGPKSRLMQALSEKEKQTEHALNLALNLDFSANVAPPQGAGSPLPSQAQALTPVSPGQKLMIVAKLHNGSKKYWITVRRAEIVPSENWLRRVHADQITIAPGEDYYANFAVQVPATAPVTRPYWHRNYPARDATYEVDPKYQTLGLPPSPMHVNLGYEIAGHKGLHSPAPEFLKKKHATELPEGEIGADLRVEFKDDHGVTRRAPLAITPAYSVALDPSDSVLPVADAKESKIHAQATANLTGTTSGTLHLTLPSGWRTEPSTTKVSLDKRGDKGESNFTISPANLQESRAEIRAVLDSGRTSYTETYKLVTREDLGSFYYFRPAVQHISIVEVKTPKDLKVGYIMGAGDDIPTVLQQIGMNVTLIPADKVASKNLGQYGTIVLGVRAYDTHKELVANNKKLLDFVSNGGTLIVQNNNSTGDFNSGHFTPYDTNLSRARVSVEEAPVQILAPDDPIFHYPNEIWQKDFDGWVQERGLYFMDKWDDHFKPLLSCHDPGEPDQKGGMIEAKYGKGTYIYTGYAFFRQLPAGVPGAIRLFVNLVSAGHPATSY
jgi:LmbE family N-acetylglucosaminyl deacetylase